ncbi:MAG TPA: nucleotidyltransferase family protein [Gaiellaceae bacterium]|nr:nucleotidyltransferase family protein [Gaiellaceae bacterium]
MRSAETSASIWRRVDELVDGAPGLAALRAHRLQLLAGRRWRATGREVPDDLRAEEKLAAIRDAIAPELLARVRAATEQPVVLLKGPEIARRYPGQALRHFIDLDLLAPDADQLQAELLAAGFEKAEDPAWAFRLDGDADLFADKHHCHPVRWAGWPLRLEIHRRPSWPPWLPQPPVGRLLELAEPAETEGILALPPGPHALVLAAHLWVANPFARLRDVLDIALLLEETAASEPEELASAWGMGELWATTRAVVEAVLMGGRTPAAQRLWARHLASAREQTVLEVHVTRWASPFWALPPRRALGVAAASVASDLRPAMNEPWRAKARRSGRALANARAARSEHKRELGREGRQLPRS